MKAEGPKHERETIINFNEEDTVATVWTASESAYRQLRKRGYAPTQDNERSAVFTMAKRDVKLPRPKRALSEGRWKVLHEMATRRDRGTLPVLVTAVGEEDDAMPTEST